MTTPLEIKLLGELRIISGGKTIDLPSSRKAKGLLAYLIREPGRHTRDNLVGLLWPEVSLSRGRRSLRVALSALRKSVPNRIATDRQLVGFELTPGDTVDIDELLALDLQQDQHPKVLMDRIAPAYGATFLQGSESVAAPPFQEWLQLEREYLRREISGLLKAVSRRTLEHGQDDLILEVFNMRLRHDPYDERALQELVLYLARAGDTTSALAELDRFSQRLELELDMKPMPSTERLAARIERRHRRHIPQLPQVPTPLIGRTREMRKLKQVFIKGSRLVTIFGPPGVGKSRLAAEVAREVHNRYLDQVALVELASLREPHRLASRLTQSLSEADIIRPLRGAANPRVHLLDELSELEALLILDNFEHLVARVDLLVEILQSCPTVSLLVTSRAKLNLRWEEVFELGGLAVPEGPAHPQWQQYDAVQLFLETASRVSPDFRPNEQRQTVTRLLQLTAGLPLAVELCAAALRSKGPAEILSSLEEDIGSIHSRMKDLPDRQRNLKAAFDSSWNLMSTDDQRAFRQLSTFRGGISDQAAEQVAGVERAQLAQLADAGLVKRDPSTTQLRYDYHPLLHRYAMEKLSEESLERNRIQLAHSRYFAEMAEAHGVAMLQGARQQEARQRMLVEWENLRAGWQTAARTESNEIMHLYLTALWLVFEQMGWYEQGERFFDEAVQSVVSSGARNAENRQLEGRLYFRRGWFFFRRGNVDKAQSDMFKADQLLRDLEPRTGEEGIVRATISLLQYLQGQYREAEKTLESARKIIEKQGSPFEKATVEEYQMMISLALGEAERAQRAITDSHASHQAFDDLRMEALTLIHQGNLDLLRAQTSKAEAALNEALAQAKNFVDPWIEVLSLEGLGRAALHRGEWRLAVERYTRGLEVARNIGEVRGIALCQIGLGWSFYEQLRTKDACRAFREAFLRSGPAGLRPEQLTALAGIVLAGSSGLPEQKGLRRLRFVLADNALAELDRRWIHNRITEAKLALKEKESTFELEDVLSRWNRWHGD